MKIPPIVSRQEWEAAREELLVKEKELLRARDALAAERRRMPRLAVESDYRFDGPRSQASLVDLFEGRRQLIVYHFWFEPGEDPCEGCSLWVNNVGDLANLHARDTSLALVSRAPSAEIEAVKERTGWTLPWFSMVGEGFNREVGYSGEPLITVFLRRRESRNPIEEQAAPLVRGRRARPRARP